MGRSNKPLPRTGNQKSAEFIRLAIAAHLKPITDYLASLERKRKPSSKRRK
jgi:hypothetical protein